MKPKSRLYIVLVFAMFYISCSEYDRSLKKRVITGSSKKFRSMSMELNLFNGDYSFEIIDSAGNPWIISKGSYGDTINGSKLNLLPRFFQIYGAGLVVKGEKTRNCYWGVSTEVDSVNLSGKMRIHGPGLDSVISIKDGGFGIDSLIPPESESTYLIDIFDVKLDNIATGYDIKNMDLYCGSSGGVWITYIQNVSSISMNRIRDSVSFRYNLIDPERKQGGFYEYFFNDFMIKLDSLSLIEKNKVD